MNDFNKGFSHITDYILDKEKNNNTENGKLKEIIEVFNYLGIIFNKVEYSISMYKIDKDNIFTFINKNEELLKTLLLYKEDIRTNINTDLVELIDGNIYLLEKILIKVISFLENPELTKDDDLLNIEKSINNFRLVYSTTSKAIDVLVKNYDANLSNDVIQYSPITTFVWKIEGAFFDNLKLRHVTSNVKNLTGYSEIDFRENNINFLGLTLEEDSKMIEREFYKNIKEKKTSFFQEHRIRKKNGEIIYIRKKIFIKYINDHNENDTRVELIYGFVENIDDHYLTEDRLLNRNIFEKDIEKPGNKNLLIIKVQNIDNINGLLGRQQGTSILKELQKRIIYICNKYIPSNIYQISNKEYCFLQNIGEKENNPLTFNSEEIVTEISKELEDIHILYEGIVFHFNYTIGTVFGEQDEVYKKGLLALDVSREMKNPIIWNQGLDNKQKNKQEKAFSWIKKIKEGIKEPNKFFSTHFQGILDNQTGEISKYESLIRYKDHDTEEYISPFFFLDHVKEIGHEQDILYIMINNVIRELVKNRKKGKDIEYSLNFTINNIINDDTFNYLETQVRIEGIDRSAIIIEILEEQGNEKDILNKIQKYKEAGYKIAIDDFGTGNSNFERLLKISPDYIKIDGVLIKDIEKNDINKKIVSHICLLAKELDAKVIAEFVDNKEKFDILKGLGVNYSQGYFFHEPTPQEEFKV